MQADQRAFDLPADPPFLGLVLSQLTLGRLSETFGWLTGKEVTLTKFKVAFSCATRYYNIEKARRVLGYEPRVGMQEAIKRSADWWMSTPDGQAFKAQEAGKKVAVAQ